MARLAIGSKVIETRFGAVQNDQWHSIPGSGKTRGLKTGRIQGLTARFLVGGYDAEIAWDDGSVSTRVADLEHLQFIYEGIDQRVRIGYRRVAGYWRTNADARAFSYQDRQGTIREYAEARGISELIHFTRTQSLTSIVKDGLLTNATLRRLGRKVLDSHRYDGKRDYICLSIGFPNYQMMYSYTQGKTAGWCVLILKPCILWQRQCLFYPYNAAASDLSERPTHEFDGTTALRSLYDQTVQGRSRHQALPASFPTSPQAEVLVKGSLSTDDILGVHFADHNDLSHYEDLLEAQCEIWSEVSRQFFAPRLDWKQWSKS